MNADVKSKIVVANDRMSALAEIGLRRGEEEADVVKKKHLGISRADKLMAFQSNRRDGDI